MPIDPSFNINSIDNNGTYAEAIYAFLASGGFTIERGFSKINIYNTLDPYVDVTGSIQVMMSVDLFNAKLGGFNAQTDSYATNSITITANDFISSIKKSAQILSTGAYSTLYSDFASYVKTYFGIDEGFSSLFAGASEFAIDVSNNFTNDSFIRLLNGEQIDASGQYIRDLSGSITLSDIRELLLWALDSNALGNRDPAVKNWGLGDGFVEGDLIWIPEGTQITLNLDIENEKYNPINNIGPQNTSALNQSTTFVNGNFTSTTNSTTTNITRTVKAPLLIKLVSYSTIASLPPVGGVDISGVTPDSNPAEIAEIDPNQTNTNYVPPPPPEPILPVSLSNFIVLGTGSSASTSYLTSPSATWSYNGNTTSLLSAASYGSYYYAVGKGGNTTVVKSLDGGVTWRLALKSPYSVAANDVLLLNRTLITCGSGGNTLAYITDVSAGNTWTTVNTGLTSGTQLFYDASATRLYVVGAGSNTISFASSPSSTWSGLGKYVFNEATTIHGPANYTSNRTWVAVGQGSNALTYSTDGKTYTANSVSPMTSASSVAVGADTFGTPVWVAGGQGGNTLAFSKTPSLGWSGLGSIALSTACKGVQYGVDGSGQHVWVAVGTGTNNSIVYSKNPTTAAGWYGLGKNIFTTGYSVACGKDASGNALWMAAGTGTTHTLAYSRNPTVASSWVGLGKTIFSTVGFSVAYGTDCSGNPIWMAAGQSDTGTINALAYSRNPTNAASWVGLGSTALSVGQGVAFGTDGSGNPLWLAVGSGVNTIVSSQDPTNAMSWTGINTGLTSSASMSVSYGIDASGLPLWIVGQLTTNTIVYSNYPTVTWNTPNTNIFSVMGTSMAQNKSPKYIAGGIGINNLAGSIDGQTWYPIKSPFAVATNDVYWSQDQQLWVAVGEGTHTLAHSKNGIEWEGHGISVFSVRGKKVTYSSAEGKWYATGEGTYTAASSVDGHNWIPTGTTIPIPVPIDTNVMVLLSSALSGVSLTNVGTSFTAPVGSTMSTEDNMTPAINAIAYDGASTYYAGGTGTTNMIQSTDGGTSWYSVPSPFTESVTDIIYAGNALVAAGTGTNTLAYNLGSGWAPISIGQTSVSHLFYDTTSKLVYSCGTGANSLAYSGNVSGSWIGLGNTYVLPYDINTIHGPCNPAGGRLWVAGGNGTNFFAANSDIVGNAWTGVASSIFTITQTIAYGADAQGNPVWIAGGNGTTHTLGYSANPKLSWTGLGNGALSTNCVALRYGIDASGNKLWVAGGSGTNKLAYSTNPTVSASWIGISSTIFTSNIIGIEFGIDQFGNPIWFAAGLGTNSFAYSYYPSVASSWVGLTITGMTGRGNVVKYGTDCSGNPLWMAGVISGTNTFAYSRTPTIASSWVGLGNTLFGSGVSTLEYGMDVSGRPMWMAGGTGTTHSMAYSFNPINSSSWIGLGKTIMTTSCTRLCYGTTFNGTSPVWAATGTGTNKLAYSINPTAISSWVKNTTTFTSGGYTVAQERIPKYIAGGTGNYNMSGSIDGLTWFYISSPFKIATNDVLYVSDAAMWVAVGEGINTFAYSYNGINWIGLGTTAFDLYGKSITYNSQNMMLYATGYSLIGGLTTKSCQIINLSQWNNLGQTYPGFVPLSISNFNMYGSILDPSAAFTFDKYNSAITTFAVDNNTSTMYAGGPAQLKVASSVDGGITWTGIMTPFSTSVNNLTVAGNQLVAAGSGGTSVALYDGTNWSSANTGLTFGNHVFYDASGSRIYAMGTGANTFSYSPAPALANGWNGLGTYVFSNGINTMNGPANYTSGRLWVAVGGGGNNYAYSSSGTSGWVRKAGNPGQNAVQSISYGLDGNATPVWMAATTSYAVSYSYDGQSFTQINTNYTANFTVVNDIKYGYDVSGVPMWVACGTAAQTGTSARTLQYSYTPTVDGAWQNLAFNLFSSGGRCVKCGKSTAGNVLWVAGGQGGNSIAYSTTGFTWTGIGTTQFIDYCSDVEYGTDGSGVPVWVAVGSGSGASGNTIAYSNDGNTWVGLGKQTFTSYGSSIAYGTDGSGAPLWVASGTGGNSLAYSRNPKIQSSWIGLGNTIATSGSNGLTYGVDGSNNPIWMLSSNIGTNNTVLYYSYNPIVAASWTKAFGNDLFNGYGFQSEQEKKPKFIVGGTGVDNMRGSMDGQTWYYIKSLFTIATNDVCWSQQQQMWVAVGEGGNTLAYSSNGITWTGINLFSIRGKKVSYDISSNKWYATGEGGISSMFVSLDAKYWVIYPLPTTIPNLVMLGTSSTSKSLSITNSVSPFTYTWVGQNMFTVGRSIAYNGASTYYAVGDGTSTIQTSTDNGNTWSSMSSPFTTSGRDIIYAGSQLVACGSGTNTLAYLNNTTWTPINSNITDVKRLYYEPNIPRIFAMGQGANTMSFASSVSGTWTGLGKYVFANGANVMHGPATYFNKRFMYALASNSPNIQYSIDETTFKTINGSVLGDGKSIAYGVDNNLNIPVCVVGTFAGGSSIGYSYDGINWYESTTAKTLFAYNAYSGVLKVIYGITTSGTGIFIAVGSGLTNSFAYSYNGVVWTGLGITIFPSERYVKGICQGFDNNGVSLFVAVNTDGIIARSSNGTSWLTTTINYIGYITSIEYGVDNNGKTIFVVCGYIGQKTASSAYSYDGITWIENNISGLTKVESMCYGIDNSGNKLWLVGSANQPDINTVAYSFDGINWVGLGNTLTTGTYIKTVNCINTQSGNTLWIICLASGVKLSSYNPTILSSWVVNFASLQTSVNVFVSSKEPKYIAGSTGSANMKGSIDGQTWYYISSPFTTATNDVYWSQSQQIWVAVGEGKNTVAYSTNGMSWTGLGTSIFSVRGNKISFSTTQNMWFIAGEGTNTLAASYDGKAWMPITSTAGYVDISGIGLYVK